MLMRPLPEFGSPRIAPTSPAYVAAKELSPPPNAKPVALAEPARTTRPLPPVPAPKFTNPSPLSWIKFWSTLSIISGVNSALPLLVTPATVPAAPAVASCGWVTSVELMT